VTGSDRVSGLLAIGCAAGDGIWMPVAGVRVAVDEVRVGVVDVSAGRRRGELTVGGQTTGWACGGVVVGGAHFMTDARPNTYYIY